MPKAKYEVLDPLEHNGKRIEPGGHVVLDDDAAAPLLALRAIAGPLAPVRSQPAPAPAPEPAPTPAPEPAPGESAPDAGAQTGAPEAGAGNDKA